MILNIFTKSISNEKIGESSFGIAIFEGKILKKEIGLNLGRKKIEETQLLSIIKSLKLLTKNQIKKANIFSDSKKLIEQLKGENKNISENHKILINEINSLSKNIDLNFHWIPEEENKIASNIAKKNLSLENKNNDPITNKINEGINKINNRTLKNNFLEKLKLDKAFFGKINCLKIQMNFRNEVYFHMGLINQRTKDWIWEKVKMSDLEIAEIVNVLRKEEGKCSFFHMFDNKKTQIWCNKSSTSFTIKIKDVSKNMQIGEFEVLRIILEECIRVKNFSNK